MKKVIKKLPAYVAPIIGCVFAACLLAIALYYNNRATSIGNHIGQGTGAMVGKAIGSLEGITTGRAEGKAAGKETGLSAQDTKTDIESEIKEVGNLEVLVASVKIKDFHAIGEDVKYSALYLMKGEVVFSIDLSKAEIQTSEGGLKILLPLPTGELYIDQRQVDKIAEYQEYFFSGSSEDGYNAYINTLKKIQSSSVESLSNYNELIEAAKISAKKQVRQLALTVSLNTQEATVQFKEG